MPVITLEIMSNSNIEDTQAPHNAEIPNNDTTHGLHFLNEKSEEQVNNDESDDKETMRSTRSDLLEYMMRTDGSVVCKLCGEILQSRTHWYRHKYKLHVIQPFSPAPLFQCDQCLVYFKSRKGYIGHIASKHSEALSDTSPVLTNKQAEAAKENPEKAEPILDDNEKEIEEPDPEQSIPKTCVLNYQTSVVKQTTTTTAAKVIDTKKPLRRASKDSSTNNPADLEEKRSREEKLVADIIDRVRRECEAQGSGGAARRGYTRRYTVMHT